MYGLKIINLSVDNIFYVVITILGEETMNKVLTI